MMKAYRFRLYPTKAQAEKLSQHIGSCRFVYNWALNQKIKTYEQTKKSINHFDLDKKLPGLKIENPFLKDVNAQSLQGMTKRVDSAFTRFFREKKGFPKFKSKKNPVQAFPVPQHYSVNFETSTVKLPKIGEIKAKLHRKFTGDLRTATVSKTRTGEYFISILVENNEELPVKQTFSESTTIGIDVGIKDFAVHSTGEKIENPKYLKSSLKRLKVLQKRVSRKQKGSKNREKAKQRLAKLHERITNQRNDFQHKLRDREWTCPDCKTKHDRDINAAINLKKFALIDQNLIGV